jgi:hypothetical protein
VPRVYVGDADNPARLRAKWLRHQLTWQRAGRAASPDAPAARAPDVAYT